MQKLRSIVSVKSSVKGSVKGLMTGVTLAAAFALTACNAGGNGQNQSSGNYVNPQPVEKVKPNPGKGNVQGQVFYNSKPVENIEVKLCEKFNRFISGQSCEGKNHKVKTDREGYFVITDVDPGKYQVILVRVFNTDSYIFAAKGIAGLDNVEQVIEANKTLFIDPKHLFKSDLKLANPEDGERIAGQKPELNWQTYPDATYYTVSLYPKDTKVQGIYNQKVTTNTLKLDKPLVKGDYTWKIEAYNGDDKKLSATKDGIKFTVD
jgi:hypothetical protein